jgi:hypothetical protein
LVLGAAPAADWIDTVNEQVLAHPVFWSTTVSVMVNVPDAGDVNVIAEVPWPVKVIAGLMDHVKLGLKFTLVELVSAP